MKVYIYKTSDRSIDDGTKREFGTLDECIKTLISETKEREYVISTIEYYYGNKDLSDCMWLVEVYDYYRE